MSKTPRYVQTQYVQKVAFLSMSVTSTAGPGAIATLAWSTRPLNTLSDPQAIGVTLASNQFILPAGTYVVRAKANFYRSSVGKLRIQNITDATTTVLGMHTEQFDAAGAEALQVLDGTFTITVAKLFELQNWLGNGTVSGATGDSGTSFGGTNEIHTNLEIQKIA